MREAHRKRRARFALVAAALVGAGTVVTAVRASDHQDTPEVELNPRMDINDVYAFPGSSADRIALVMTTSSPIVGQNAQFDPNLLYQLKIDNSGDAVEDLVFQVTFDEGGQTVRLRGPVAPASTGTRNTLVATGTEVTGTVGQVLGSAGGVQLFAGLRSDPLFIDLEQFFRIVPDRRPSTGPLATQPSGGPFTSFRNPGVDLLRTLNANTLAIAIELPKSQLVASTAADAKMGVWATISR